MVDRAVIMTKHTYSNDFNLFKYLSSCSRWMAYMAIFMRRMNEIIVFKLPFKRNFNGKTNGSLN